MEKKSLLFLALLAALLPSLVLAQTADRIIVESRADSFILLKDLVAGKVDIIAEPVEPREVAALPADERAKLLLAYVPYMSWSLLLNPASDAGAAPGIVKGSDGVERFNPFGIAEVRQALSRLIDRRKVVDEICGGRGVPMFLMVRPDSPGNAPWNRAARELGYRERGDPAASTLLRGALRAAAADPRMRGRLALSGKTWLFENAPVRVKFLIRADDAKGRLLLGRSIADLIRNQGMEVEALEYERSRCSETMNKSDPADLAWSIYTEGWGTVFASQRHEEDFVTQYCPSGGSLPGASRGLRWRYSDDRLDALGADLLYGRAGDRVAHELASTKASRLALEEAVRVYVAGRDLAIVANANRLGTMPLYDRSGGFGSWTWRSATPAAGPDGKRTLRIGVKGPASPFSSAWDSFGVDGFANPFQHTVLEVACDFIELPDPATASPFANRDRLVESAVDPGGLAVPATALVWDGASAAWKPVAPGTRAKARLLFEYDRGPWQDGQSYTSAEIAYSLSMTIDWSKKDGAADKAHDSDIESFNAPWLEPLVAFEFPDDRHVVVYGNSSWTWDLERLRYSLSTVFDAVPWPIDEALENLVLNGGASGARYRFNPWEEGYEEVDLAAPKVFADLESELERLAAQRKVPSRLAGIVGLDEAQRARVAALSFMRSHGHALDSNGPWVVDKIWYDSGAVELAAFKAYPFPPDRARKLFSGNLARIDQLDAPPSVSKRAGFVVSCVASTLSYPEGVAKAAGSEARATLRLIGGGSEKQIAMMAKGGGRFEARILPAELAALPPGTYCVEAEVQVGNTLPDLHSAMLSLLQ